MPYEPAINTTLSSVEKVKERLNTACWMARDQGLGIIGFVVTPNGGETTFEAFSSFLDLEAKDFVELLARAGRQMLKNKE